MLKRSELKFLEAHGLTEEDVFDWRGLGSRERRDAIKRAWKTLALGAECSHGHRLRTRSGHCVECDPAKLSYQSQKARRAVLYVGWSSSLKLFKVGVTDTPARRIDALRREAYGGAADWSLFMALELRQAGKAETAMHRRLASYQHASTYQKGEHQQASREVFKCTPDKIIEAFTHAISPDQVVEGGFSKRPDGA